MKFKILKDVPGGPRIGSMILGGEEWSTPSFLTSAPCGCVPNLTRETLEMMKNSVFPLGIPFNAIVPQVLEAYKRPMNEFMGLQENPFVLLLHEGSEEQKVGFFSKDAVSVWSTNGNRCSVKTEDYIRTVKASKPHAFVALSDSLTPKDTTKKRIQKSVSKSLKFLSQVMAHESPLPPLLAPLGGGFDSEMRNDYRKAVLELDQNRLSGYVIEGFHTGGLASVSKLSMTEVQPLIAITLKDLPQEKPRFMVGAFDPWKILCLIESGIDMFESSYPHLLTERGEALSFDPSGHNVDSSPWLIDLNDEKYKNTFEPVVNGCSCYACEHHTKAYVHHLLMTKELLAKVILMIHNLHHFKTFFGCIRRSIEEERFQEFKSSMKKYSIE